MSDSYWDKVEAGEQLVKCDYPKGFRDKDHVGGKQPCQVCTDEWLEMIKFVPDKGPFKATGSAISSDDFRADALYTLIYLSPYGDNRVILERGARDIEDTLNGVALTHKCAISSLTHAEVCSSEHHVMIAFYGMHPTVGMLIDGDFFNVQKKIMYAQDICDRLNSVWQNRIDED